MSSGISTIAVVTRARTEDWCDHEWNDDNDRVGSDRQPHGKFIGGTRWLLLVKLQTQKKKLRYRVPSIPLSCVDTTSL